MSSIGTFASNQFILRQNTQVQARLEDLRVQVATGKKSQQFDGIAKDVRRLEGLEKDFGATRTFKNGIERTELRLEQMETSINTLQEIAADFRTTLISAANDGGNLESIDLESIARDMRDEAIGELNSELAGRFLFAGSATRTEPIDFSNVTSLSDVRNGTYYKGNDDILSARANPDLTIDYGITADPNTDKGFHKLFQALTRVIEVPAASSLEEQVESAIRDLSGATVQRVLIDSGNNISDPDAPLNAAENLGAGSVDDIDFDLTFDGQTENVVFAGPGAGDTTSLRDIADQINAQAGNDLEARVARQDGHFRLEIFSRSESQVTLSANAPPDDFVAQFTNVANGNSEGAIQELADTKSELGSSLATLENTRIRLEDKLVDIEAGIADIENIDLPQTMTLLTQEQTTLQASFAVTARLSQVSLLNFLR